MIPDKSLHSSSIRSSLAPRVEQPRERGTESSSTVLVVYLLSDEGEGSTGTEVTLGSAPSDPPTKSLSSSCIICVTSQFWMLLSRRIISCSDWSELG
jgi:hypothetical protein